MATKIKGDEMGKRKVFTIVVALVLVLVTLFSIGCSSKTSTTTTAATSTASTTSTSSYTKPFEMGTMLALTGEFALVGQNMLRGEQLALSEVNTSGDLPMKLEINAGDHAGGNVDLATAAARKQLDVNHISIMLSSWPNVTAALAPLCGASNVGSLNGGGNGLDLLGVPWLVNTRDLLDQFFEPLLGYFANTLHVKNLAIIGSTEESGVEGSDMAQYFAPKLGMKIVDVEQHEPGLTDYKSLITKIKAANPDGLIITSYGDDISYIIRDAKQMGLNIPTGTFMDLYDTGIAAVGPEVHEGLYGAEDAFDTNTTLPWAQAFIKNYTAANPGITVEIYAANYYELVYMVKDAINYVIKNGGNPYDGKQIYDAILKIGTFKSLYGDGTMTLLPNGTIIKPVELRQFHNGQWQVIQTITPPPTQGFGYKTTSTTSK